MLRAKLRERVPEVKDGPRRMAWMSRVCEGWSLEDLCAMTEGDMEVLLEGFERGEVRSLRDIRGEHGVHDEVVEFDGSFGWAI